MDKPVIFITGSARGIGGATARLAKEQGWQPVLHGRTESARLKELAQELDAPFFTADVSDKPSIQSAIEQAYEKYGRLDALANCAGIVKPKPFLEMAPEDWQAEYQVNTLGSVFACQAAIPLMQKQENGGRIVNISSIRGLAPTMSARGMCYSMSKAAVCTLTETLAKEFSPKIAVNAVAPGFTATDMAETWSEGVWDQARSALAGRPAEPQEIAATAMFLASSQASFITGQTIVVDGGYTMAGK
ncbi:MAG: SDR family oxidoreductase [Alphaproteobacteria bacterium]|nr:SDR family oxidoreductase [Alphaproteobacteria bacterium]MDD9919191.1 SDR family oxidoreductase [Alphaproteobacteria bacterium]